MKWIDIPPVWLILALVVAYALGRLLPLDLGALPRAGGTALVTLGLGLIALAAREFLKHRTTIIPRQAPAGLITSGIFRVTRNPIYLGDALILAGLCLRWDAALALPLVPLFVWFITRRFIEQEEQTLGAAFPQSFPAYLSTSKRWL